MKEGRIPKPDLRLVPQPYASWVDSRTDIMRGDRVFEKRDRRKISDEEAAIEQYFSWMRRDYKDYMKFIQHIFDNPHNDSPEQGIAGIAQLGRRSINPMDPECRLAVIIPAKHEERNIYKTLSSYADQVDKNGNPFNPKLWEINIIVNTKDADRPDKTYEEIIRFKNDYPHIKINALEITVEKSWARVGFMRKAITDISLFRSNARVQRTGPLYIESDDADLIWVDRHLADTVISTFDLHPELDSLTGYQEKDLRAIAEVEHVFLSRRFWDIMTAQAFKYLAEGKIPAETRDFEWSRPFTYGVNTAHTAEAHALIGGYDWDGIVGEDLDIGKRISLLRGKIENGQFVPELRSLGLMRTRTNSSPRRYLWGLYKNIGYIYSKDNFAKEDMRTLDQTEMINSMPQVYRRITEENKRFYEKELWFLYENLRKMVPNQRAAKRIAGRTMILLGFKHTDFEVTDDGIGIISSRNFSEAMAEYRKRKPYT